MLQALLAEPLGNVAVARVRPDSRFGDHRLGSRCGRHHRFPEVIFIGAAANEVACLKGLHDS